MDLFSASRYKFDTDLSQFGALDSALVLCPIFVALKYFYTLPKLSYKQELNNGHVCYLDPSMEIFRTYSEMSAILVHICIHQVVQQNKKWYYDNEVPDIEVQTLQKTLRSQILRSRTLYVHRPHGDVLLTALPPPHPLFASLKHFS